MARRVYCTRCGDPTDTRVDGLCDRCWNEVDYCSTCGKECPATGNIEIDPFCDTCAVWR